MLHPVTATEIRPLYQFVAASWMRTFSPSSIHGASDAFQIVTFVCPLSSAISPTCWMAGESLSQSVYTRSSIVTVPRSTSSRASMGTVPPGAVCSSSNTRTTALVMSVPSTTASARRRLTAARDQPSNRVASRSASVFTVASSSWESSARGRPAGPRLRPASGTPAGAACSLARRPPACAAHDRPAFPARPGH